MSPSKKVALMTGATGATGQDGTNLAEFLLTKDCELRGIKRSAG